MPRLQRKGFSTPDEVRSFPNGRIEIVTLDEISLGRFVFQPGWRWSTDVSPITGARSCQHRHVGYTVSGSLEILMDDGTRMTIGPGDAYEIPPGHDAWVVGEESWDSVEFTSAHDYARPPEDLGERILATILFSDIVNSTAKLEEVGDQAWAGIIRQHNERIRSCIDRYKGRELAATGDGFLALFDGAARALQAAEAMDGAMADLDLRVRVGIHTGDVEVRGGQARGVAVHAAARVAALAGAGEVLVSGTTCDMLDGSGIAFDFHGNHQLKGLTGPRPIFLLRR